MTGRADVGTTRRWAMLALALALVATAYSNGLEGPFVWDDRPLILDQVSVHHLGRPSRFFAEAFWAKSPNDAANDAYYRPLVSLSYALNWASSGAEPVAFHLTNLVLHLVACALLFVVAMQLGAPPAAAAAAAAVVGVLPRLTECVTWISGRTDILAAVFALAALAVHRSEPGAHLRRWVAGLLILGGLLSKEVAVSAVAALAALELRPPGAGRAELRRVAANLLPAGCALIAYALLRASALAGIHPQVEALPLSRSLPRAVQVLGAYLVMLLDPLRPRLQIGLASAFAPGYLACGVAVVLLLALALRRATRARWPGGIWAGGAFALTGLALVLQVVPIRVNTLTADRFLYSPALGLGLAMAVGAGRLRARTFRLAVGVTVVALPILATATFLRNRDWADELRLWRVAAENTTPANALPRTELGNALFRRGSFEAARESWEAALPAASPAERKYVVGNLAAAYSELGRYDEARQLTRALLEAEPALPLHHYNLGIIEARSLRLDQAERELRRALELLPDYPLAARALGIVREAREASLRLPPEAEGEPMSVKVARAHLDQRLGRRLEAERRWVRLLDSDQATAEQVWQAARFLLGTGTPDGARHALARLRARGLASADQLEELRGDRARREAEGLFADDLQTNPGMM